MNGEARAESGGCANARELLGPALDGELSPDAKRILKRHLAECDDCRLLLAEHERCWELLGRASPPPPAGEREFLARVQARIRRTVTWRAGSMRAAAAAALVLVATAAWLLPGSDDQAIIENMAVLEDLEAAHGAGTSQVAEVGRELLAMLESEPAGVEPEDWSDVLDAAIDETEKGG